MSYFIKRIHINQLLHLQNFDIPVTDEHTPHLLITGKNGSGKTILLNAIAYSVENIKRENETKDTIREKVDGIYGGIELDFVDFVALKRDYQEGNFIMAFYQTGRKTEMIEPKNPTKPIYDLKGDVKQTATSQFLNFMSDLKIQEALARNEKQIEDANQINQWFVDFEGLLRRIYQDSELQLKFNYRDYSFRINTEGKSFKFTELSDGFAAILDIVADLILKMQIPGNPTRVYNKKGIVLIDEVETHLHLELQRIIMPILVSVFPNIQFIITTHSPFVLNSLDNAIAFDLEHRKIINELTQYSYEALAEGYFGVSSESSYMQMQLDALENLLKKEELTAVEKNTIRTLVADLDKVPESVSPNLVGAYLGIKNKYASALKTLVV